MIEPGLFEIGIEDYRRDPCPEPSLNNSLISALLQAPAKARAQHPRLNATWKPDESKRLDLGSVAHKLLLGRGREIEVLQFDSYRTNAAKEARDAARLSGHIPVLVDDYATACAMEAAARAQLIEFGLADAFGESGKSEVALFWRDATGAWGRNLIDRLRDDLPTWEIWDYKTTDRSARPEDPGLGIHVVSMGYDTQCAMQERGLTTLFPNLGGRLKFRLLFQETEPPYLISVVEPDAATMTMARKKVDYAFTAWANCLRTEKWAGYTPKIVPLRHAEYLANKWLQREIEEIGIDPGLLPEPPPPKRGRGRPKFSRNKSKKQKLAELMAKNVSKRAGNKEILEALDEPSSD